MPMHDWTRVEAGIYHAFHLNWIAELAQSINRLLPKDYYALPEQHAGPFGPDILTLRMSLPGGDDHPYTPSEEGGTATLTRSRPRTRMTVESGAEFYHRKQRSVAIRHVSNDQLVALVELVSPGNKSSRAAVSDFVTKAAAFIQRGAHMLVLDPLPATKSAPHGIHAAIWEEILAGEADDPPANKPLVFVSYECGLTTTAYLEPLAVGDSIPPMPLFLEPGAHILVPLDESYEAAFNAMPLRWRRVIDPSVSG